MTRSDSEASTPGSSSKSAIWRWSNLAAVLALVVVVVVPALGLYRCAVEPPARSAFRVVEVKANQDDPGFAQVCTMYDSGLNCFDVAEEQVERFGPVGGCVLVESVGEGPIRPVRQLDSSECDS